MALSAGEVTLLHDPYIRSVARKDDNGERLNAFEHCLILARYRAQDRERWVWEHTEGERRAVALDTL